MVAGLYAFRPSLFSYLATCDLVGFGVEHRVLLGDESVELGLEQVLVDLHDALWRGSISYLSIAVLFWRMKIVHRTRAVPFHVRAGIRKCIRIRALSASNISVGKYVERIGVVGQTANMGVVKHFLAELIQSFSA